MGRRGPAREPTELMLLRGNPGHRRLKKDEPKPRAGVPDCPDWLTAEAKKEWAKIAVELKEMGVLTVVDGTALAAYCQAYARWREAEEWINENGSTFIIRDKNGKVKYVQQFPQVAISKSSVQIMHKFLAEFGMTPSSRTRIAIKEPQKDDEEERFFGPRKAPKKGR